MKDSTKYWLISAEDDLKVIREISSDPDLTNMIAFHAQQCIEKTLKAMIEEKGIFLPKIHDLIKLFDLAGIEIQNDWHQHITILNDMYLQSRYPGEIGLLPNGKPNQQEAEEFLKTAT